MTTDVLVLNAGFTALDIISKEESIRMLYTSKAYTVVESERTISSPSITMRVPNVIALLNYKSIPKRKVGFSKLSVIYRDNLTCQYCGEKFTMRDLTIDHIIPKSRWAKVKRTSKRNWTTWENCVCSCIWCNNKKGNRLLEETDMKLSRKPYIPKYLPKLIIDFKRAENKGWLPFTGWNVRLINSPK
ncbi:MAG: HNH endonuclease [PVC group bacterium]|nr:HNH endonuclease [PVC group bacterium]